MKKFLFTMVMVLMMLSMVACGSQSENASTEEPVDPEVENAMELDGNMVAIGYAGAHCTYYYDAITDVMFVRYSKGYAGGLTVMQDPETGMPMTWTKYQAMMEEKD